MLQSQLKRRDPAGFLAAREREAREAAERRTLKTLGGVRSPDGRGTGTTVDAAVGLAQPRAPAAVTKGSVLGKRTAMFVSAVDGVFSGRTGGVFRYWQRHFGAER